MKRKSIKTVFSITLTFIIIVGVASQAIIFYNLISISTSQQKNFVDNVTSRISIEIEEKIDTIKRIADKLSQNQFILDLLNETDPGRHRDLLFKCAEYINNIQNGTDDILYAVAIDNAGNGYKLTKNMTDMEYEKVLNVYRNFNEIISRNSISADDVYCDLFNYEAGEFNELYACSVSNILSHDFKELKNVSSGILILCNKMNLNKMLLDIDYLLEMNAKITNEYNGNYIEISLKNVNKSDFFQKKISSSAVIYNTVWELSGTYNVDNIEYRIKMIQILFAFEILIIILMVILLQRTLNKKIIRPVQAIVRFLNDYELAARDKHINVSSVIEIENIANHINKLLRKIKNMTRKLIKNQQILYEAELTNKQTSLYALQNQVNPHFLYNVLECIRGMALLKDADDVADVAASVSDIMRYTLSNEQQVTLGQEIRIVRQYINIMNVRYPGKFITKINIPEELEDCQMLKMTIQPIVENAFNHGEFFRKKKGVLEISAQRKKEHLEISVYDNGKGISEEKQNEISESLKDNTAVYCAKGSIGLANINSRLKLQFGEKYGLTVTSEEGKFTKVIIKAPIP